MDERRFDSLTRVLGAGMNRRQVVRGLAAGAGGGLLAALRAGEVLGKKPKPLKACGKACVMKGGVCCEDGSCPAPGDGCCPEEKVCSGGCLAADDCCPYTERECPDGSCAGQGSCCPGIEFPCAADPKGCCNTLVYALCDGRCIDPWADADHCGHCDTVCDATENLRRRADSASRPVRRVRPPATVPASIRSAPVGPLIPSPAIVTVRSGHSSAETPAARTMRFATTTAGCRGASNSVARTVMLPSITAAARRGTRAATAHCIARANTAFCCDDGRCIASGINTCNE